jgi:hypothetical protein
MFRLDVRRSIERAASCAARQPGGLDLYAAQVSAQLRAARNYRLLITDKTVMNVTAYARLVHNRGAAVLSALETLSAAWAPGATTP